MASRQGAAQTPGMKSPPVDAAVFGTVFVEIINPNGAAVALPGWITRLWPVARLGDQTLEARPSAGSGNADQLAVNPVQVAELLSLLRAAGVTPLGVRLRPGPLRGVPLPVQPAAAPALGLPIYLGVPKSSAVQSLLSRP